MSGARRVWTAVAAALLSALTVLLLCRYTVADPAYYTGAVREADGYQRVYDEVLPDPAVRRALRTGALGIPLRSDAVVDNLPLLVPRPALEQAADRQARALVAALTGTGRAAAGNDWRGPVTESATEAGSDQLRALREDADPAAARGLTHLITRLREYVTPGDQSPTPTSALREAVATFVHDTWPPSTARRIMTALDEVLPGAEAEPHTPTAGAGAADRSSVGEVRPPLVGRGDEVGRPGLWTVGRGSGAAGGEAAAGGREPRGPLTVGGQGAELRPPLVGAPGSEASVGPGTEGRGPYVAVGRPPLVASGSAAGDGRGAVVGTGGGVPAVGEQRVPLVVEDRAGGGTDPASAASSKLPGWGPERGAVVRTVLAASASWWAVAGVAAGAAGAGVLALRAAARGGRFRARTAAAACAGAAVLTAAAGAAVWAALPASAGLVPDGLPPSVAALLADVVAGLYREAALAWAGALLALTLTATALTTSETARKTLYRTLTRTAGPTAAATAPAFGAVRANPHRAPDTPVPTGADSETTTDSQHSTTPPPPSRTATAAPGTPHHPSAAATPPPSAPTSPAPTRSRRPGSPATSAPLSGSAPPAPTGPRWFRRPRSAATPAPLPADATPPPSAPASPPALRASSPATPRPRWARQLGLGVAGFVALAQVWMLVGVPAGDSLACNGDVALCGRPYDQVVQVGAHNAMATVPDGFLGAHQDVSLTGQLDRGARALLLDTHYWETAERLVPPAGTGGLDAAARATLVRAVDSVVRPRPGTWLCHGPCRMGATPLTAQLRELRDWLEEHPRDVVTLILQDAITPRDTARAFRAAGLGPYLHRPDPDPAAPWPTLGEMADSGRRLVVFAEEADGPAPWYRNFYEYAVETPYRAREPGDMSCAPHRGGNDPRKRLFLLNHFVTHGMGAPRAEAAAVNDADAIVHRARTCALLRGRMPTIIAVNHMTLGDAVGAVRRLNSETR
ncbi:hypothetical protein [Streptomyces sp. CMB-StM0423]|uniref:hypothetical protein n=1 Tax=Streptomyces sp. CMB-StM0423 TaxID=2059884 RepID=UPI000C70D9A3|nr:hypothetical protein [Streptomyces sp. CMB-StM0423]AUH43378.1 hypothetical protein CXR04_27310 [Streptomyces sp. CMB-StM0423]